MYLLLPHDLWGLQYLIRRVKNLFTDQLLTILQSLLQLFSQNDNLSQFTLIYCFSSLQLYISKRSNNRYFQPTLQIGFFPQWKTSLVQAVEPAQLYAPLPVAGTTQFAHPTYYIYYLFYAAAFKQQLATTITLHCQLQQHQPTTRNTAALLRWKFQTSFSHAMYFYKCQHTQYIRPLNCV